MGNSLALIELTKTFAYAGNEIYTLLDILPGGAFREFFNAFYGNFLYSIASAIFMLPLSKSFTTEDLSRPFLEAI